jgi:hypothetical protein
MFFWNRSWTSFFSFFWNMMPKNVILGPPTKSTGVQNGAQNLTSGAKRPPKSIRRCLQRAVLEATGDTEAPICARGTDLSIFCCIFQASKFYFFDSLHKCDIRVGSVAFSKPLSSTDTNAQRKCTNILVVEAVTYIFADRCTASNRNKQSRTAKNLQKSLQRNCIAPIYRFAKRQQLQQTHAPKRRFTK